MSVSYRIERTAIGGLTKDSMVNGRQINKDDFLEMAPDFSGLLPKIATNPEKYGMSRYEANAFAEILGELFSEPYTEGRVLEGKI